ncbi:MAG: TonB-dependent receptor plug domain-containing protein [Usitatibacter sp.]
MTKFSAVALATFGFSLSISAALAQQAQKVDKVEVTGSSIKRIDAETALPVQILKREDIERIGATTTEELLKQVTAVTSAGGIAAVQANGTVTTSQSAISLRGLGDTRTLVLVNGRRVAVFGGTVSTAVDVNSIPVAAIERIEVLKEGASSLYGSDAVAGVVNFILRRDYTGGEVTVGYGEPSRSGGGKAWNASGFAGFGNLDKDRYNVNIGAGYDKQERIQGKDRAFARQFNVGEHNDLSSTIAFPGNILFGPNFARLASPAFPDCGPTGIDSPFFDGTVNTGRACRFENSPFLSVQPETEKKYFLANARYRISSAAEAYVETAFTRTASRYTTQPVPISEATALPATNPYVAFINNLVSTQYPTLDAGLRRFATAGNTVVFLPPSSPYYPTAFVASLGLPTNQPIAFRYRDFANGLRETEDTADNSRIVAGLKGALGAWDYDSAFLYSESKAKSNLLAGYPLYSRFLPILDSGVINPFAPTTDPAVLAAVQAAELRGAIYSSKTSTTSVDFKASSEVMQLRAGSLGVAAGAELREEKFTFSPSQAYQIGDVAGFGGNIFGVDKKRHVASVYGEAAIPILRELEVDFGVRFDDYQSVGNTTNPKVSFRWTPSQEVLLRASYGSGFRAPSLTDLYNPQGTSVTANGTRDPLRCPVVATGNPSDCNNQFPTTTGGNPDLKPEKSRSGTLGFVFEPTKQLSIGADAFWISLRDQIVLGGLNFATILLNADNATRFSNFLIRGAPDGNASGLGPIVSVIQTNANLFKAKLSGYDVNLVARPDIGSAHHLTLRLDGTYMWQYIVQNFDGSYRNNMDTELAAGAGVTPKWRHVLSATYDRGPWMLSLQQNFQDSYNDITGNQAGATPRVVGAYETFDAQMRFTGVRNLQLTLGVKNITDRDPPYTNGGGQFAAGYDISYADVRGRFVYGSLKWSFR